MSTGAGEAAPQKRPVLAGPVVNNPRGLFKSLETTSHFSVLRAAANSTSVRRLKGCGAAAVGLPGLPFFWVHLSEELDRLVRHNPLEAPTLVF